EQPFYSLCFSPDGKALACGFSDRGRVLDITTGRVLLRLPARPWIVGFASDGKTLAAAYGKRLRLWDVTTGDERHAGPGEFSPDGRLLASADWMDQAVSLWDLSAGRLIRELPLGGEKRYVRNLSFSADGKTLTACQFKGFVQTWDVETGRQTHSIQFDDPTYR